ncbi:MAG: sigma factor [Chthoniobacteraceae bacterium]|nr:sigma factor [Chthoniobacteraceae bacterium]
MESSAPASASVETKNDLFATTRWTVVLEAGHESTPQAKHALEELCRTYWYPLYAYVRRRGYSREDAEDLTQAFFAHFLEKRSLEGLSAERGRFRAFLLASLKHFLANEWDKANSQKRGGRLTHLSLDWETADSQFQIADHTARSPDNVFDQEWATALLGKVIEQLRLEHKAARKEPLFARLKPFLIPDNGATSYAEAAGILGMEEGAVRTAVHRLRKRYRTLLRNEIAQTLTSAGEVEEEMRTLFGAFAH